MSDWITVGRWCVCGHRESDHENAECAYGWTDEPDEDEPCDCERFRYHADDVVKANRP